MKRMLIAAAILAGTFSVTLSKADPNSHPSSDLPDHPTAVPLQQAGTDVQAENDRLKAQLAAREKEIQQLKAELAARNQEIKDLKAQVAASRARIVTKPELALPYGFMRPSAPAAPSMPPGSQERPFNGSTFYVVPLTQTSHPTIVGFTTHITPSGLAPNDADLRIKQVRGQTFPAEIVPPELLNSSK